MNIQQTRQRSQCSDSINGGDMEAINQEYNVTLHVTQERNEMDENIINKKPETMATIPQIPFLDGIRGLACFLVVLHHMMIFEDLNLGGIGVDIFFVLSALLLTLLFERKAQSMFKKNASFKSWGIVIVDYASKRFLRIYPLFACVACTLYFMTPKQKLQLFEVEERDFNLFKTLTFDPKHCHHVLWSLPVEIQYYFCLPVITILLIKFKGFWYIPVFPLMEWVLYHGTHVRRDSHDSFFIYFPTFLCGSLAAIIYLRIADAILYYDIKFNTYHHYLWRTIQYLNAIVLASIIIKAGIFVWLFNYTQPIGIHTRFTSLPLGILIISEMIYPGPISTAFEWSVLRFLGKIGYSVYLLHYFILHTSYVKEAKNRYDRFLIMILFTTICSYITYRCIEKPSQVLAAKISKKLKQFDHQQNPQLKQYQLVTLNIEEAK